MWKTCDNLNELAMIFFSLVQIAHDFVVYVEKWTTAYWELVFGYVCANDNGHGFWCYYFAAHCCHGILGLMSCSWCYDSCVTAVVAVYCLQLELILC